MENDFWKLVNGIPEHIERMKEENLMFYGESEDGEYIVLHVKGHDYLFDREGFKIVEELWKGKLLTTNDSGYLAVKDNETGETIDIHRQLKIKEVEEMAKVMKCPERDIEVHHQCSKYQNTLDSLQVVHKDTHAAIHGCRSMEELREKIRRGLIDEP